MLRVWSRTSSLCTTSLFRSFCSSTTSTNKWLQLHNHNKVSLTTKNNKTTNLLIKKAYSTTTTINNININNNNNKEKEKTGLRAILNDAQHQLLEKEIKSIEELVTDIKQLDGNKEELLLLENSIQQLEDLFLLVVVGEFNSGKSSFLNALLGDKYLNTGVTPTTSKITILKHDEVLKHYNEDEDISIVQLPVEWLKEISLVDTPGTNAVITSHQRITEHFVPRSDLILFVTSVDRAFSESEVG
jgi:ribosome biogenesis GTPase A